jgi:hypothetical protein
MSGAAQKTAHWLLRLLREGPGAPFTKERGVSLVIALGKIGVGVTFSLYRDREIMRVTRPHDVTDVMRGAALVTAPARGRDLPLRHAARRDAASRGLGLWLRMG